MKIKIIMMLIMVFLIVYALSVNAVTHEKELPIENFMGIYVDDIIEQVESLGWEEYYIEKRKAYGIWDIQDGPIENIAAVPYLPQMYLIQQVAKDGINMVDVTQEKLDTLKGEYEKHFEKNNKQISFQIYLSDKKEKNVLLENTRIIYEDKLNGKVEITKKRYNGF